MRSESERHHVRIEKEIKFLVFALLGVYSTISTQYKIFSKRVRNLNPCKIMHVDGLMTSID